MKARLFVVAALVVGTIAGAGLTASAADTPRPAHYLFRGTLTTAPGSSATLQIHVQGGNRLALRKLLGQSQDQSFAVGSDTEYLRWQDGVPTVVQESDLAAGDRVAVHVRAPRSATLAEIEATAAGVVADHGSNPPNRPENPLYLFRGKLTAVGSSTVTVDIKGGNQRALRLLIGQPASESFAYDTQTTFLLWKGKVPSVISASQLTVGDRIVVRIRAPRGSTLAEVEATAAKRVAEHERAGP